MTSEFVIHPKGCMCSYCVNYRATHQQQTTKQPPRIEPQPADSQQQPFQTQPPIQQECGKILPANDNTISAHEHLLNRHESRISDHEKRICGLEGNHTKEHPAPQKWFKSWGVWLAVGLTIAALYGVYLFWMAEHGKKIVLPW